MLCVTICTSCLSKSIKVRDVYRVGGGGGGGVEA